MEESAIPHNPHVIFHGDSQIGTSVILQNRNIDPYITIQNRFVHFGFLHLFAFWQINWFVIRLQMCRHYFGSGFFGSSFNTTVFVAFLPIVTSMVEHDHFFSSGGKTLSDDFFNQFRIRISCQFRHFIPTDIRFYNHFLSRFHELLHTPQFAYGTAEHLFGFSAHNGHQIRIASVCFIDCLS